MEICARLDALEETQEMLLDSFVDGERRLRWNPATAPRRAEPPISPYRLLVNYFFFYNLHVHQSLRLLVNCSVEWVLSRMCSLYTTYSSISPTPPS